MPRKAFIADLQQAKDDRSIDRISDVQAGNDDGEFTFLFSPPGNAAPVSVSALISDVSEYPKSHEYHIFAADDTSPTIAAAVEDLPSTSGKTVSQLLALVSRSLSKCTATGSHEAPYELDGDGDLDMPDSQAAGHDYEDEDSDNAASDNDDWDTAGTALSQLASDARQITAYEKSRGSTAFRSRIRSDLRRTKEAGLKLGYLGAPLEGHSCYVSVSCRIAKLGISEEAMNAWQLDPSQYLILLIAYPLGYKSWSSLQGYDSLDVRRTVQLHVGLSDTYKPTLDEAIRAFSRLTDNLDERKQKAESSKLDETTMGFRDTFISKPLDDLLNERLVSLVDTRLSTGMLWEGAELFYHDIQTCHTKHSDTQNSKYWVEEGHNAALSSLVTADHIMDKTTTEKSLSFPLVAFQFLLRHFVRCTEFCLVCHCKLTTNVEAIKPYVCDRPLCLYQYMSLGFGPSIEHEIIASPYVVDLLVSFCYASARSGKLKDFPTGLSLSVPPTDSFDEVASRAQQALGYGPYTSVTTDRDLQLSHDVRFDGLRLEIIWDDTTAVPACPVKKGDWIVLNAQDIEGQLHCRVSEVASFPTIRVSQPVKFSEYQPNGNDNSRLKPPETIDKDATLPSVTPAVTPCFKQARFAIYNQNFDQLNDSTKRFWVCRLLDLLPAVQTMREYLIRHGPTTLSSWLDRISPAALSLLRWIIVSNRSCIIQADEFNTPDAPEKQKRKIEERVYGMPSWKQFRFAMGAPDKEQRFVDSAKEVSARLHLEHPTLFAWHGSPLGNWHSIIRQGLHFNNIVNGRAYGNGCYHSLHFGTSQGYSGYGGGYGGYATEYWPQSFLNISTAVSLNEIVNAPDEFVSKSPHLVVAQLDWIQTRYLFVKCNPKTKQQGTQTMQEEAEPLQAYHQDPKMTPHGESSQIIIPATALGRSWRSSTSASKKQKIGRNRANTTLSKEDDADSVATLTEDLLVLIDDEVDDEPVGSNASTKTEQKYVTSALSMTDFVPGSLDYSKLPLMEEPSYATPAASKRLQKDFKALLKVQSTTPFHELGWYTDPELFDNVYQWIVELHSFEAHLPLAKDMKKAGIKSVVLELRFGKDYPMSPPFVRVIRPRFLSFMQGGGGHVTAGGALCMELLTNSGWSAVSSIESVLLQVRLAISSTDPKPARLQQHSPNSEYGIGEAVEAYIRACVTHGWTVPEGFKEMGMGVPKPRIPKPVDTPTEDEVGDKGKQGKVLGGLKRMFGAS